MKRQFDALDCNFHINTKKIKIYDYHDSYNSLNIIMNDMVTDAFIYDTFIRFYNIYNSNKNLFPDYIVNYFVEIIDLYNIVKSQKKDNFYSSEKIRIIKLVYDIDIFLLYNFQSAAAAA